MILKYLLLFISFPGLLFAQDIQWICQPTQGDVSCNGYITTKAGKTLVAENYSGYMKQMSVFKMYSPTLGAVNTGCGSYCTATNFINLNSGAVSSPFSDVIAVNTQKNYVAYLGDWVVIIQPIFNDKKQLIIKKDFAPTAIMNNDIDTAKFLPNGDFYLSYDPADPSDSGELTIKIDYSPGS